VGLGRTSWHGFAEEFVRRQTFFTGRTPKVIAIPAAEYPSAAKRPANGELDTSKFQTTFGFRARPWQERVGEIVAQLLAKAKPAEPKATEEQESKNSESKGSEKKSPDSRSAESAH
jgi:dTDP-4-dehydrorhamnose reductase